MVSAKPQAHLLEHVRRYCGYWERTPTPLRRREVPSGEATLIISFGPDIALLSPVDPDGPAERRTSFVAGIDDAYAITEHAGEQHGIEVNLSPLGAGMLLGVSMGHVGNRVIELDDLLGPDAERLTARLYEAASWEARFALLDAILSERLDSARAPRPGVAWAWRSLVDSAGRIPIGALASELGWSHRRLTTRFREEVGVAPKLFARILRFERALGLLKRDDGRGFAEIAYSCGYADQAHFNRDFRSFAGSPPSDFLGRRLPDSSGFAG
jgi:AraC-like DNA-binding protein